MMETSGIHTPSSTQSKSMINVVERPFTLSESIDADAWELARAGKKQVLERRFGLVSMVGFCCSVMMTWEAAITNFTVGLTNGGPAGLIWSFLVCWVGTTSVFAAMGELASMLPTAGGQYHWTSILAPPRYNRFLSYVTGWVSVTSWIVAPTVASFTIGEMLQSLIQMNNPNFKAYPWQAVLMMYAALFISLAFNSWLGTILPILEIMILIIHVLGFFALLVTLLVLGSVSDGKVFTTFFNAFNWPTTGLSFMIGFSGNTAAFLGTDAAIHMTEEVSHSTINTPRSMTYAVFINGVLGFVMLIVFSLVAGNLEEILQSQDEFPFMQILQYALSSNAGAIFFSVLLIFLTLCCLIAGLSSGSRMLWSFAREEALPGWRWLRKVNSKTSIPVYSTYIVVLIAALLGLINLGSTTTFNALLSLVTVGFYSSYLISLSLLLYRRLRGDIKDVRTIEETSESKHMIIGHEGLTTELTWGPWRLKGWWGIANNIFAIAYLVVIIFFGFWPVMPDPDAAQMNYSIAVFGGVSVLSLLYYFAIARKHYSGANIEVEILKA